ncbi:alpha/beta hydrolase [Paenibacillus alginolyticus]|nr:alpha/beta hydrolase [Paenibacillus alginolyticus]MCY9670064.1 alpha/beta hydrolase [Paenibacillus alginolyticus]
MILLLIAALVAVIFLILVSASFYFYRVAIACTYKSFLNNNPDLAVTTSVENPLSGNENWWIEQAPAEWSITSNDGLKLHAYYMAADQPTDKTVILAHGYAGQAMQMGNLAQMYRDTLGFNVLLPDARGHGRSEGHYIGFGWPERKDYVQWINKVIDHSGEQSKIVLHGVSMGGTTVMMTSGEALPSNVKAIVEDCGYSSVKDQLAYQLRRMYRLPVFPLLHLTSLLTKLRAGYFFGDASAIDQIQKSKTPMLFIHGGADLFVPSEMVYELFKHAPSAKHLLIVPGAGHGLARHSDPVRYDREVAQFIGEYV